MTVLHSQGKSANLDTFLGHTFIFRDNKERFLARRVSKRHKKITRSC
jgi:hypothetical protein